MADLASTPRSLRSVTGIYLAAVTFLSFLSNNLSSFWMPNGSDEFTYIGLARRLVEFENKTPHLLPFTDTSYLISYWIGLLSTLTGISAEIYFRIFHGVFLFFIVALAYELGKTVHRKVGLLLAPLIGFSFSPVFYPGQAYFIPSIFLNLGILLLGLHLIQRAWRWVVLDLLLITLFYWYGLFPCLILVACFVFVFHSPKTALASSGLLLLIALIPPWEILAQYNASIAFYLSYFQALDPGDTLERARDTYELFGLPLLGAFIGFLPWSKTKLYSPLLKFAGALIFTTLFFYFTLSFYLSLRTLFFLYLGGAILLSCGAYQWTQHLKTLKPSLVPWFYGALITGLIFVGIRQADIYQQEVSTIPPFDAHETEALRWLNEQDSIEQSLIISDYSTLRSSLAYVNSLSARYIESDANGDHSALALELSARDSDTLQSFYGLLQSTYFYSEDLAQLHDLQEQTQAEAVYLIISPRTRKEIYYRTKDQFVAALVLDSDFDYPPFIGESKFENSPLVELVYSNETTQIYQFLGF